MGEVGRGVGQNAEHTPSVSVVIPARNAETTIAEQLAALASQETDVEFEVLVVLNGCTDGTEAVVRAFQADIPDLVVVHADDRTGVAHARNRGCEHARGRMILHCDADDIVAPGWVDAMTRVLAQADVVGGRLEAFGWPDGCDIGRDLQRDELPLANGTLRYAVGASFGYHRALAEQHPFFGEIAFGGEDLDFSLRVQQSGARLAFVPDAVCRHRARTSWHGLRAQMRWYARGDVTVTVRNDPEHEPGIALSLAGLAAVTLRGLRSRDRCERRRWMLMRVWWIARFREHLRQRETWLATRPPNAPNGLSRTLGELGRRLDGKRAARLLSPWTTRLDAYQPRVHFTLDPLHPTLGSRPATAPLGVAHRLAATGGAVGLGADELHDLGAEIVPAWSPSDR